jgi:hypothetical protein
MCLSIHLKVRARFHGLLGAVELFSIEMVKLHPTPVQLLRGVGSGPDRCAVQAPIQQK